MSFISQESFEERVNDERNMVNILGIDVGSKDKDAIKEREIEEFIQTGMIVNSEERREMGIQGKVYGDKNIPEVIRDVITLQSNFAPVSDVAKSWGVSPASASNLKNGVPDRTNPSSHRNIRAQQILDNNVTRIRKVVEKKILSALALITNEALENHDAKALSVIAKNLSGIISGVENKEMFGTNINVQTIFYAPEAGRIEDYDVISG